MLPQFPKLLSSLAPLPPRAFALSLLLLLNLFSVLWVSLRFIRFTFQLQYFPVFAAATTPTWQQQIALAFLPRRQRVTAFPPHQDRTLAAVPIIPADHSGSAYNLIFLVKE